MESLTSYIPSIVQMITDSIIVQPQEYDTITSFEFANINFNGNFKNSLLIGYERGFQIWDISNTLEPIQLVSKRNSGISRIHYILSGHETILIGLCALYDTSEFHLRCIKIYSLLDKTITHTIKTSDTVNSLASNKLVLCASLDSCIIEIFSNKTFLKLFNISEDILDLDKHRIIFGISNLYIAYSIGKQENLNNNFACRISKTVRGIAMQGYSKVKGLLDEGLNENSGKVVIKNILTGHFVTEINAFAMSVSILKFSKTSHLLVVGPSNGHSFHVYRINPTKYLSDTSKHYLIYKLIRGLTDADITDISISKDEK